jgi:hypothetical protein
MTIRTTAREQLCDETFQSGGADCGDFGKKEMQILPGRKMMSYHSTRDTWLKYFFVISVDLSIQ